MKITATTIFSILFPLLFIVLASGCGNPDDRKAQHYQNAMEYVVSGNVNAGIIEFRNAIKIDPRFAEARYQLGLAYLKAAQPKNAFNELERAASLDPKNTDALIRTAEIYFLGNDSRESREKIRRILEVDPAFADAYALLARIELKDGNTGEAEAAITRALELDADQSRYHMIRARVMTAAGKPDRAEKALKAAIERDTGTDSSKALAEFYAGRGRFAEAEQTLRSLIDKNPDTPEPYLDLALFHMGRGQLPEAEKQIVSAIENHPESSEAYMFLGDFHRRARAYEKAEQTYLEAIGKLQDTTDLRVMLADLYCETGRFELAAKEIDSLASEDKRPRVELVKAKLLLQERKETEALGILEGLLKDSPRWSEAHCLKGAAHLGKGEVDLSLKAVDRAIELNPFDSRARALKAHHFLRNRDYVAAESEAARALQLAPGNLGAAVLLGKSHLALGKTQHALDLFEALRQYAPENIEILYNLSAAFLAANDLGKSGEILENILKIDPGFTPALLHLAQILIREQQPDEAISVVRKQLELLPDKPEYRLLLADLLDRHGNASEEALWHLDRVREIAPDIPLGYTLTAGILMRTGKTAEAIETYRKLTEVQPGCAESQMALGALLEQTGDYAGARAAYARALELRPGFAAAANNLAWRIANSPEPDLGEALRLALIAKEARPDDPHIADTLGWIHYKRGSHRLALTQFAQAVEKSPDMPVLHYHRALALIADGQADEARDALSLCLAADVRFPEYADAIDLMAEIDGKPSAKQQ